MKLIESKAEYIPQEEGLEGIFKQIEICGRTCYKSLDKMKEGSARGFVGRMINSNHTAMLEQGTVYLAIKWWHIFKFFKYLFNPYSKVHKFKYVTTNYRVLYEHNWIKDLQYICSPTKSHERRYTFKLITDRGVSHELVKHRVFSFAQESTRYCNYSKDKFGNEISYIIPSWYPEASVQQQEAFMQIMKATEDYYMALLGQWDEKKPDRRFKTGFKNNPLTPQQARQVLPNALKTEVCMTGFASDWRFFFDLRFYGETGKPHPDMELLAGKARSEFIKAGLWDDIMSYPSKFDGEPSDNG